MSQKLPYRSDVPLNETWDLSDLYKTSEEYELAIRRLPEQAQQFKTQYEGQLNDLATIENALKAYSEILVDLDRAANYSALQLTVETTDAERQRLDALLTSNYGDVMSRLSFVETELLSLDNDLLQQAIDSLDYPYYLQCLKKRKKYQLHPKAEETLANMSQALGAPSHIYGITKMLDIDFGVFEVDGQQFNMDYTTFEGIYEDHENTSVRRESFRHFSETIRKYQHTTAALYNSHVQNEKLEADLRGYDSVIDFLLEEQDVTPDMYHRQIDIIMSDLAPIMRRYAKVVQRANHLDEMKFEDLKISVDPTFEPTITIEESKKYIYGALSVLGDEYSSMLDDAYRHRWIDFPQNKGKETGAYCASPYASHSYIFISWTGKMTEAFVLAHELGHAGHFTLAQKHQNFLQSEASMYFVEAPSTMNEMLMLDYLLKQSNDIKFKRWAIGSIIARTYYHNMVTHLLEAAYQREVYYRVDKGESLTAPILNEIKKEVITSFWGDDIHISKGAELTWMRQPHYYMGLYPYTYSAGLTVGTIMAQRIKNEGQVAIDEWLEILKAGGSLSPIELVKIANIDLTTEQPLKQTIAYINDLVTELEKLTNQIEQENL
ncbi:oligoendopeptidase F [Staphylococcus felis]|uniref:Oligopeptidase F n=1 Tax=Staphylococcus felis TaxID=46127 RepID=A0AAX1RYV9_9STAP|nr:oligoendopeptidase F [Staphylococcus felis]MBH9579990.1 oligoendopeptidase F [Staphylococcus felis]MDM8327330.1 oligoendopeptidase F [Staphylococcus felis]MDQ7193675.1 oligoendopeptidase F [Staphylococcus felis]REH79496.1 oligoendopeptidase F [Staphylococcus felis]REH81073.1 oligoendopeptidase F [Staphylococcus felis]